MSSETLPNIRGKGNVSCRVFSFFEALELAGEFEMGVILEVTTYPREFILNYRNRIPWDDWAHVCDAFVENVGRARATELSRKYLIKSTVFDSVQGAAGALFSSRQLYHVGFGYLGPMSIDNVRFELIDEGKGPMKAVMEIESHFASAESWFLSTIEAVRMIPTVMGQAESLVVIRSQTSHRLELEITPPISRSWMDRFRRTFSGFGTQGNLAREFEFQRQALVTASDALASAEAGFERLLDAMPLAVALHSNGQVHYQNPQARTLMDGLKNLHQLADPEDAQAMSALLAGSDGSDPVALKCATSRGVAYLMASSVEGPEFEGQALDLFLGLDVTHWRELQERVSISERMASLGTLTAGIAHEINNPMTSVMGNLELALMTIDRDGADPSLREYLEHALEGAERASLIVRDMHAFARKRELDIEPVNLSSALQVAIRLSRPQFRHGVTLVEEFSAAPFAYADEQHVVQIFVNLLNNAAQACGSGGVVRVVLGEEAGCPFVRVIDDGCGMPDWMRESVFDPFFSTKASEGLGLGLSIVKRLVLDMDAKIDLESEVDNGTTFQLVFKAAEPLGGARRSKDIVMLSGLDILIIDDEDYILRTLSSVLGRSNQITTMPSAVEALKEDLNKFDVVLCDLVMPTMSGMDLYAQLAETNSPVLPRVVFMSGGSISPKFEAFIEAHEPRILLKPFTIATVSEILERFAGT